MVKAVMSRDVFESFPSGKKQPQVPPSTSSRDLAAELETACKIWLIQVVENVISIDMERTMTLSCDEKDSGEMDILSTGDVERKVLALDCKNACQG